MQLEKYRGSRSRHTCPACGQKNQFARYIDENGEYIGTDIGRCNRESSCGFHNPPPKKVFQRFTVKQWNNVTSATNGTPETSETLGTFETDETRATKYKLKDWNDFQTIDNSFITRSLDHNDKNRFLKYLQTFIDAEYILEMAKKYLIGATKDGKTVFWQIDKNGRARTGKIISYDEKTGKRDKAGFPSWIHYELKKHKILPPTFQHQICFYGEHLIKCDTEKPVAIVEAEKTASIASIFNPEFIWLAIGGKSYLKADRLRRFGKRKIVLFPDADAYELWKKEEIEARKLGLNVFTSEIIESTATAAEKASGFDLADYLIKSELTARNWNDALDSHAEKVNAILADQDLFDDFQITLDEREAIAGREADADEIRRMVEYII